MIFSLKRISHISIFLLVITVIKSILSIAVRSSTVAFFGASDVTDAYFAAFFVPQQLSDFFVGGIMFLTIIPVFQRRVSEAGEDLAFKEMSSFLNLFLLVMLLVSILYFFLSPFIISIFFAGFEEEKLAITIRFSKILSPSIIIFALSLIYVSLYHSFSDFFMPAIASLLFPLSSLFSLWLLPNSYGIERLVYGNLFGAFLSLSILFFDLRKRFRWNFLSWDFRNPITQGIMLLSWPLLLDQTFARIYPIIQRNVVSGIPIEGALTVLEISLFLTGSVSMLITGPITTAVFPLMGRQSLEDDWNLIYNTLQKSLQMAIFLVLPINIIFIVSSREIVEILFSYGKFTQEAAKITAAALSILSFSILPNLFSSMFSRILFVFHETKLFCISSILIGLLTFPLYYVLGRYAGIVGVVSVISMVSVLIAINSWIILKLKHSNLSKAISYSFILRICAGGGGMVLVLIFFKVFFKEYLHSPFIFFVFSSTFGISIYVTILYIFSAQELRYLIDGIPILANLFKLKNN